MFVFLFRLFCYCVLRLRYRIAVRGLDVVRARGTGGILFLPCHPALIDPVIVVSTLITPFAPHTVADADAVGAPGIRQLVARFGVRVMPGMARQGAESRAEIARVLAETAADLRRGENVLLYPAGRLMRSQREDLGANSAVETLLAAAPAARVVLVRTRGLWGSSFGTAPSGYEPDLVKLLLRGMGLVLLNGLFFTPRRSVTLEFVEPADLPRGADRDTLNRYLEAFYNVEPLPRNTRVPLCWWQGSRPVELPEPQRARVTGDLSLVPPATRGIVIAHLQELSGLTTVRDEAQLARDLGLDSLARAELLAWLEGEFGFPQGNVDALLTVGDVLLAASGEAVAAATDFVAPTVDRRFLTADAAPLHFPPGETLTEVFLRTATRYADCPIVADEASGVKTYRDLITSILALRPSLQRLPGDAVGIMLPASVAANVVYLAVLFAGKTPVLLNWTVGVRNLRHTLEVTGVRRVLTAQKLLARLQAQGADLSALAEWFVPLEEVAAGLTRGEKLRAALLARLSWSSLWRARVAPIAAILSTSGSESLPKAVPLSHANLLSNMRTVLAQLTFRRDDRLLGMLPPFHSFGLIGNMLLALCHGVRTVYHTNPTEGQVLARLIAAYRATLIIGTPTFLHGIVRAATPGQLATLRLAVTGAEECPPRVYAALAAASPGVTVLEGYGITECSPIVAMNDPAAPRPGTIGRVLPSLEWVILGVERPEPVAPGETGLLLVRGPSVFAGYLGDAPSPFVEYDGRAWYRTGDLVSANADGLLTFRGRLKRFVKLGGEMVSLPAIESVLLADLDDTGDGPPLAVVATEQERPELVLFTTHPLDREAVNRRLRDAGLSGLHHIRQVIRLDALPTLGTGKTDYRALQAKLEETVPA